MNQFAFYKSKFSIPFFFISSLLLINAAHAVVTSQDHGDQVEIVQTDRSDAELFLRNLRVVSLFIEQGNALRPETVEENKLIFDRVFAYLMVDLRRAHEIVSIAVPQQSFQLLIQNTAGLETLAKFFNIVQLMSHLQPALNIDPDRIKLAQLQYQLLVSAFIESYDMALARALLISNIGVDQMMAYRDMLLNVATSMCLSEVGLSPNAMEILIDFGILPHELLYTPLRGTYLPAISGETFSSSSIEQGFYEPLTQTWLPDA